MLIAYLISAALLTGAFFILVGSIGLLRLRDFYARVHAPTKATTLGMSAILAASMVYFGLVRGAVSLHELLITLFLFMSAPVSAYLLAKAALHLGVGAAMGTDVAAGQDAMPAGEGDETK
jgi:multicomponent K+:H+ antiporter subunit G